MNWSRPIDADWIIEPLKYKANPRNFNSTILSQGEYFGIGLKKCSKTIELMIFTTIPLLSGEYNRRLQVTGSIATSRPEPTTWW